ncbi:RluA family pseudouridine synthase [Rhodobacteraceae bacterium NNCM2]|nr:RluA family pseudouridine synthase [Coraliihabitans acroporae]
MSHYAPPEGPLAVIHRDEELLLVDKPSGLLSVPGKPAELADCLEARVRAAYPQALLIHRLDMETSGIMVFALNKRAQRLINGQFEKRLVKKTYIARVAGEVAKEAGRIDLPLIADWPNRPMQKVCHETGKPSITNWAVMAREPGATRLELKPETGRSHQLRVHLAEMGHPIMGDPFYAPDEIWQAAPRLQLHARALSLRHPDGGAWMTWEAPCPF